MLQQTNTKNKKATVSGCLPSGLTYLRVRLITKYQRPDVYSTLLSVVSLYALFTEMSRINGWEFLSILAFRLDKTPEYDLQ